MAFPIGILRNKTPNQNVEDVNGNSKREMEKQKKVGRKTGWIFDMPIHYLKGL